MSTSWLSRLQLLNWRYVRGHQWRTTLAAGVITLSAALIVAVFGTYGSVSGSVAELSDQIAGNASLEVTGITDAGLSQQLVSVVAATEGVGTAAPVVQSPVLWRGNQELLLGIDGSARTLGSALRNAVITNRVEQSYPDGVFVGPSVPTGMTSAGQHLVLSSAAGQTTPVTVLGTVLDPLARTVNDGSFVIAPLAFAQRITGRPGRLDSILIVPMPGQDSVALQARLNAELAGRAYVAPPSFRVGQATAASAIARDITLLVALLTLVVAGFLVFNTTNMAASERRAEMAILRALGARRKMIMTDFLTEAAVVALVGSAAGCAVGVLIASVTADRLPAVLTAGIDAKIAFHLPASAIPIAFVACVLACVLASWLAAHRVSSVQPVAAMRHSRRSIAVFERAGRKGLIAALVAGVAAVVVAGLVEAGFDDARALVATPLLLVGVLLMGLALMRPIVALASRVATKLGAAGRLASASIDGAPRRVWATTMTVVIAVAIGMAITGALQNTVAAAGANVSTLSKTAFIVQSAPADVLPVRPLLPDSLERRLASVPGVRQVVPGEFSYANLDSGQVLVQGVGGVSNSTVYQLATPQARRQLLTGGATVISTAFARQRGLRTGDTLVLPTLMGPQRLHIAGIVDYISLSSGLVAISFDDMARWFHQSGASFFEIMLANGADPGAVEAGLDRAVAGLSVPVHILTGSQSVQATEAAVGQVGAIAYALQWIVACVAALVLLNTLMLSVVERQRELGILRALGATRAFTRRIVLAEAGAVGLVGGVLGIGIGFALHYLSTVVLAKVMALSVPFHALPISVVMASGALLIVLAGSIPPARRAGRLRVVSVIGYE